MVIHDCPRKQEKSEINNLKPEAVGEKRTNNTQSQQKERNHKDQSRTKDKTIEKINEMKSWFFGKKKIHDPLPRLIKKKGTGPKAV